MQHSPLHTPPPHFTPHFMISQTLSAMWFPATGLTRMKPCSTRPTMHPLNTALHPAPHDLLDLVGDVAPGHRTDPDAAMQHAPLQYGHGPGAGLARVQHQARQALGLKAMRAHEGGGV